MSLDLPPLIAVPILVGHAGLIMVLNNMGHGVGLSALGVRLVKLTSVCLALAIGALIVAAALEAPWTAWPWPLWAYGLACLATALVGWPLGSLVRARRRLPAGITGRADTLDLAVQEGKDTLIGTGKHRWLLRLPGNESLRLSKVEWEIALPNLPRAWDGLSLVQLTDLHFSPCFDRRFFEVVADEAAAWDADIVAF
jgi:hypothetical protein